MPIRGSRAYANVVSTLALMTALGGTAYAAVTVTGADVRDGSLTGHDIRKGSIRGGAIADGSLTTTDILDGTINSKDVGYGSLNGDDIEDGSLTFKDFRAGELPAGSKGGDGAAGASGPKGGDGAAGATGPKGETGDIGPKGETGDAGPRGETGPAGSGGGTLYNLNQFRKDQATPSQIALPAGNYMVTAKVDVTADAAADGQCLLTGGPDADPTQTWDSSQWHLDAAGQIDTVSHGMALTLSAPGTVLLRCSPFSADLVPMPVSLSMLDINISALRVAAINP